MLSILCVACNDETKSQENSSPSYAGGNPFVGDKEVFIRGERNWKTQLYDKANQKKSFVELSTGQKIKFTEKECIIGDKKYDVEYKEKGNNIWSIRNKNNDEWYDFRCADEYKYLSDIDNKSKIQIFIADVNGIKEKADKNDAKAQFLVGNWHKYGMFGCNDWDDAIKYFRRSGDLGFLNAYCELADMYMSGTSNHDPEIEKGLSLYESAAKNGSFRAQNTLGDLYSNGIKTGQNTIRPELDKALKYYKLALESNRKEDKPEKLKDYWEKTLNERISDIEKKKSRN